MFIIFVLIVNAVQMELLLKVFFRHLPDFNDAILTSLKIFNSKMFLVYYTRTSYILKSYLPIKCFINIVLSQLFVSLFIT